MKAESQVQAGLCLPGVATVLGSGLAEEGHPWAVLSCMGRPLDQALADRQTRLSHRDAVALALAGVRILRALALVGVALPDAHPGRFVVSEGLYWDGLVLADLSGATAPGEGEAGARCHALAVEWCRDALLFPPFRGRALRRELPTHTKAALVKALAEGEPPWVLAKVLVGAG